MKITLILALLMNVSFAWGLGEVSGEKDVTDCEPCRLKKIAREQAAKNTNRAISSKAKKNQKTNRQ